MDLQTSYIFHVLRCPIPPTASNYKTASLFKFSLPLFLRLSTFSFTFSHHPVFFSLKNLLILSCFPIHKPVRNRKFTARRRKWYSLPHEKADSLAVSHSFKKRVQRFSRESLIRPLLFDLSLLQRSISYPQEKTKVILQQKGIPFGNPKKKV